MSSVTPIISMSSAFGFHTNDQLSNTWEDLGINKILEHSGEGYPHPTSENLNLVNLAKTGITLIGYLPIIGAITAIAKLYIINKVEGQIKEAIKELKEFNSDLKFKACAFFSRDIRSQRDKYKNLTSKFETESQELFAGLKIRSYLEVALSVVGLSHFLIIPDFIATLDRNLPKTTLERV